MSVQSKPSSLVALRYSNYRLLWFGQLVSFSGSVMQNAAILWHVSLLVPDNQKGLALGLVGLVRILPIIIFSLLGGVVADAVDRVRLLLVTQVTMTLSAAVLAYLTFRGLTVVWPLYALTALTAAASSFDNPARNSLIPNLVPREHLANAISLNSIMFQLAAVLGPAIGGVLIGTTSIGWVYAFNAISFVAVIGALLLMRNVPTRVDQSTRPDVSLAAMGEGLRFVFGASLIRSTMLLDFFANFFASAIALLPIFAQDILHVGATGYGWLFAAPSVGALIASIAMVPATNRVERRGTVLLWAVVVYSLSTVVFGLSRNFWLTLACLTIFGASDMVSTVYRNIIRQLATPDHLRGRMTGVNMIFFMGGPQLGELEAGILADLAGAPFSVLSGGIGSLIATIYVARTTPRLRNYRRGDDLTLAEPETPAQTVPAD
jgi:MFS family permease